MLSHRAAPNTVNDVVLTHTDELRVKIESCGLRWCRACSGHLTMGMLRVFVENLGLSVHVCMSLLKWAEKRPQRGPHSPDHRTHGMPLNTICANT